MRIKFKGTAIKCRFYKTCLHISQCITLNWDGGGKGYMANVHYRQRAGLFVHVQYFCGFPRPS
jgi:hypothetical protein